MKSLDAYQPFLEEIRHTLHENPELGLEEHKTSQLVADRLNEWGYSVRRGLGKTGVVGTLKAGNGTKTIGIRADMDALPILEKSGKPWASMVPGKMHGCGHDGHTAMLLGTAKRLAETKNFNGTVHLIFQPGEEMVGGGEMMVNDGLFDEFPCDAIFAMHNMTGYSEGVFYFQNGPLMASTDQFLVTVHGVGGHGALPQNTVDPVMAAAHMVTALQTIVSRNVAPQQAAVITVGSIQAGEAANVIPDTAVLKMSVRTLDNSTRELVLKRIPQLLQAQAQSFGASAEVKSVNNIPVLLNNEEQTRFAYQTALETFGPEKVCYGTKPLMGSEDFSFMLQANPHGSYIILGAGDGKDIFPVHHPAYDFNDALLVPGCRMWVALVEAFLK